MKGKLCSLAFAITLLTPLALTANAQSVVDFREAIRSAEPSLLTVTVAPPEQNADAPEQEQDADPPKGPRIDFFDLEGQPLNQFRNGQRRVFANARPLEMTSAAFVANDSIIIAFVGSAAKSVNVENIHGERFEGDVIALDHVTGLAAIKVDPSLDSNLVISVAQTEPGLPVVAAWIDDGLLTTDAGMISTRPAATGSGVGMTPGIDFGSGTQRVGAPVLDATGIVIGVLVPSRNGGLVCAPSADVQRLVDAATGDRPRDLKRGLIGIQFEGGGALVQQVSPDSAAAEAGIKAGDLVQQIGQQQVRDAEDVVAAVASARAGDTLEIVVRRGQETITIPVTLTEHPQQRIARIMPDGGGFEMQRAFELKDGKLVPMEIDPGANPLPRRFGRVPMEDMLKELQRPDGPIWRMPNPRGGVDGFQIERSDVEKTLKELQRQMEQLNEKLDKPK